MLRRLSSHFAGELSILAEVVAQAPQFAEAHYNYGLALKNREKIQTAVEELRSQYSQLQSLFVVALAALLLLGMVSCLFIPLEPAETARLHLPL